MKKQFFTLLVTFQTSNHAQNISTRSVLATKLCELFRAYDFRDDQDIPFKMTASFGIATFPDDAKTKDGLIRLADQAMYRVKETTRDAVQSA